MSGPSDEHTLAGVVTARAELSAETVPLSGEVTLTVTLRGPLGLKAVAPPSPLTVAAARDWRVASTGESVGAGERGTEWVFRYTLEPQTPGDAVAVAVAAFAFRTEGAPAETRVEFQPLSVRVTTTILKPDASAVRPVTRPEYLPPAPRSWPADVPDVAWLGLSAAVAVAVAVMALWKRRPRVAVPTTTDDGPAAVDALRRHVEERTGLPATRRTTAELAALLAARPDVDADVGRRLIELCERADRVKYAGAVDAALADSARAWLAAEAKQPLTGERPV